MYFQKIRTSQSKRWCWWSTLAALTILTVIFIAVPLVIWTDKNKEKCYDYESDDESSEQYPFLFLAGDEESEFILCEKGEIQMKANLGIFHRYVREERVNVYEYSQNAILNITRLNENCLRMEWTGISSSLEPLRDCYIMKDRDLSDLVWFGAHEMYSQSWPMKNVNINMTPFLPHDYLADLTYQARDTFGPVLHPLWLVSNGAGILVDRGTPLSVSIQQDDEHGEICLQALPYSLECIPDSYEQTELHYTVCIHDTVVETAKYFLDQIANPRAVPARETFESPIWSTWGAFKTNINSTVVKNYLANIRNNHFEISQLELDDGYGWGYGDLCMDLDTTELEGVPLTAWVHPFINPDTSTFMDKVDDDIFLPGKSKIEGDSVSLVKWWHSYGAVINYLDDKVVQMQHKALTDFIKNFGLTSLKFDAGEVTYLPKCVYIQNGENPGNFTTAYAAFVGNFSKDVTSRAEVRVGYYSQENPMWVRLLDRSSTWGLDNGLHSVLTAVLTFGIAGYPFVLADMIGGNGDPANMNQPADVDTALYVRWMQLSTFLPVMQFSLPPFDSKFARNVTDHARELVKIHKELADTLYNLSLQAVETGYPIIRPLWWIDNSAVSMLVNDQFLIGDDIMIAPILEDGNSRCVYFPSEWQWKRHSDEKVYPDSCEKRCEHGCQFTVALSEFLYFTRVKD